MLLKFKPFTNSKTWAFIDPDTQHKYNAKSRKELVQQIVSYRAQNELDQLEFLDLVLENYLCHLPENAGSCSPRPPLARNIMQIFRGGIALLSNYLYEKCVDQETADNRAAQCISCPNNTFPEKVAFDEWADQIAVASVGDRKTMYNRSLGVCSVCTCPLRAKVWYDGVVKLTPEEKTEMEKVHCWQLKLLPDTEEAKV